MVWLLWNNPTPTATLISITPRWTSKVAQFPQVLALFTTSWTLCFLHARHVGRVRESQTQMGMVHLKKDFFHSILMDSSCGLVVAHLSLASARNVTTTRPPICNGMPHNLLFLQMGMTLYNLLARHSHVHHPSIIHSIPFHHSSSFPLLSFFKRLESDQFSQCGLWWCVVKQTNKQLLFVVCLFEGDQLTQNYHYQHDPSLTSLGSSRQTQTDRWTIGVQMCTHTHDLWPWWRWWSCGHRLAHMIFFLGLFTVTTTNFFFFFFCQMHMWKWVRERERWCES